MKNGWPWASVIEEIIKHPAIWVGLSGGMDSMVLLHSLSRLDALKGKLKAIHVNHGLSPNAQSWQTFCQQQCEALNIPMVYETLHLKHQANLEAVARDARYQVFLNHLSPGDALVLAHHLDDQIETFFLNFLRGCGVTGLSAMSEQRHLNGIDIYRPFLAYSRKALSDYARLQHLEWIEDESNADIKYSRNYLRQLVLPMIEKHWPHYRQSVSHTIESCQATIQDLKQRALADYPDLLADNTKLSIKILQGLSQEQIFMIIRLWLGQQQVPMPPQKLLVALLEQVIFRKRLDTQPLLTWDKWQFRCYQDELFLLAAPATIPQTLNWENFPKPLVISGGQLQAISSSKGVVIQKGLKPTVRFRSGGETFLFNGHHRQLKKLMQQWKIPSFQRTSVPLVYIEDELIAVVGHAYADNPKDLSGDSFEFFWQPSL
jgi:tRNA(Ile)-lysidine synthase